MGNNYIENYLRNLYGNSIMVDRMGKIKGVKDKHLARHFIKNEATRTKQIVGVYPTASVIWYKELESSNW